MASAWVHAVLSIIAFGKPYFDLNKQVDSWSEELRQQHRIMGHDYYQAYGRLWNMDDPFPEWVLEHSRKTRQRYGDEEAEKEAVQLSHCYFDRVWDDFSREERENLELALARFVSDPELLKDSAGVDVIEGKIQYQLNNGELSWVDAPELSGEYERLIRYIEGVLRGKGIM
jgi:hypothetical protein